MLKLKNTLTKQLEEFQPIVPDVVKIYQCGPTVYKTQHIGNMRAMVMGDLIRRSLMYLDYNVIFSRNYTDVGHLTDDGDEGEDKMQKSVKEEKLQPLEIANKYIAEFDRDLNILNVIEPNFGPRATDYVQAMIDMVQTLLEKDFAYETDEAVYFDISKAKDYTRLSGQKLEFNETDAGHGEMKSELTQKRNPQDFALWFFQTGKHQNAIQVWQSPFNSPKVENGTGFPGWHIECSAMIKQDLGDTIDIHIGGIEHIPVHHTNEIAQSESANGVEFVNYWLHNEHLKVDGEKMSKSAGTSYVLQDILDKGYDALDLRYFFLQAHYRSDQNFTWESLDAASTARRKLTQKSTELFTQIRTGFQPLEISTHSESEAKFKEALENDINIPQALAVVWELLKLDIDPEQKLKTLLDFDQVLGLNLDIENNPHRQSDYISKEATQLLEKRAKARDSKDWELSDKLRDQIVQLGFEVKDTADGQEVIPA